MASIEFAARGLLVAEAVGCLLLARWCWRQGNKGNLKFRLSTRTAAALFAASAVAIAYGLLR